MWRKYSNGVVLELNRRQRAKERAAMNVTGDDIHKEIKRLSRLIEAKSSELVNLLQESAEADVNYKIEYAKALLCAAGATVAEREAAALIVCERLLRDRKIKEAIADAGRESCRSLRDQLGAVSTVGGLVRAEMELAR